MKTEKKLPKKIADDLNRNATFNMFGLVNISALRARTGTKLKTDDLKKRIQKRFASEMVTEKVEFIGDK